MPNHTVAFSFLPFPLPLCFHQTRSLAFSRDVEPWIASAWPPSLLCSEETWNAIVTRKGRRSRAISSHGEEIIVGMISAVFPAEITTRCGIRFACSMINSWNLSVFRWMPLLCSREYNDKRNLRRLAFGKGSSLWLLPFVESESYAGGMQSVSFFREWILFSRDGIDQDVN